MKTCPYCAEQIKDQAIKCRWCGSNLEAVDSLKASLERTREVPLRLPQNGLVLLGAAMVLITPFLPWVHVVVLGDLNLFDLISESEGSAAEFWAVLPLVLAATILLATYRQWRRQRALAIAAAVFIGLLNGSWLIVGLHDLRHTYGLARLGIGPWVGAGGAIVMLIGGLKSQTSAPPGHRRLRFQGRERRPAPEVNTAASAEPRPSRRRPLPRVRGRLGAAVGIALGVTAAAVIGLLEATSARPMKPSALPNCAGHLQIHPSLVTFTCADGNFRANHLSWIGWGGSLATARGTALLNDCNPDCANGRFQSFPILVAATGRQKCAGRLAYTTLTYAFIGPSPFPPDSPAALHPTVRYRCG